MHRRSEATAVGDCGAPSVVLDGEHEHEMQEVKAKLLVVLRRSGEARSSGNAVTAELGGGVHGGRALARACSAEGEGGGEQGGVGSVWDSSASIMEQQGRGRAAETRGEEVGAWCPCAATTSASGRTGGGHR